MTTGLPKLYPELQLPILSNERMDFFIELPDELPEYLEIGFYKIEVVQEPAFSTEKRIKNL